MLDVCLGRLTVADFERLLEEGRPHRGGPHANPAQGYCTWRPCIPKDMGAPGV